jgi:hypothetical protein
VFISYAWDDEEYRYWVIRLAARLRKDGVDARIDYWHLEGNIPEFMNREIRQAHNVLVLCSPAYRERVLATEDGSTHGSGWEARLVTGGIFTRHDNKMLVALARGEWKEAAPDFLYGQAYFDLSGAKLESEYLNLLRRITGTEQKAPPLGELPPDLAPEPPEPLDLKNRLNTEAKSPLRGQSHRAIFNYSAKEGRRLFAPRLRSRVGRETELNSLLRAIAPGTVVPIVGYANSGKTHLVDSMLADERCVESIRDSLRPADREVCVLFPPVATTSMTA